MESRERPGKLIADYNAQIIAGMATPGLVRGWVKRERSRVATINSRFGLTVGAGAGEKAHGWRTTNRGYPLPLRDAASTGSYIVALGWCSRS